MAFKCIFLVLCLAFAAQGSYIRTLRTDDMSVKTVSTRQNEIECIEKLLPDVVAAGENFKDGMLQCADPVIGDAKEWFQKLVAAVSDDLQELFALMEEMEECTNVLCQIGVFKRVGEKMMVIVEKVDGMIDEFIEILANDYPEVVYCFNGPLAAFQETLNDIVDRFMKCRA